MIGIDTNVLVRYLAQDDAAQAARATTFIETECSSATPGFIALIVLVEVVWVRESCYGATRAEIAEIVRRLLSTKQLVVQDAGTRTVVILPVALVLDQGRVHERGGIGYTTLDCSTLSLSHICLRKCRYWN